MIYTQEVENMCPVAQGVHHGAAPVPTEGKWVQNKKVEDISSSRAAAAGSSEVFISDSGF